MGTSLAVQWLELLGGRGLILAWETGSGMPRGKKKKKEII